MNIFARQIALVGLLITTLVGCSDGGSSNPVNSGSNEPVNQASSPTFSLETGIYHEDITVELAAFISDATIHYTIDGSKPTTSSPTYESPILIEGDRSNVIIQAIATHPNFKTSEIAVANYQIEYETLLDVTFSHTSGTYPQKFGLTLEHKTEGSTVFYTLDGTLPTTMSAIYENPIMIDSTHSTTQVIAMAAKDGMRESAITLASFVIDESLLPRVAFELPSGNYTSDLSVLLTFGDHLADIHYTTDGSFPTINSPIAMNTISLQGDRSYWTINAVAIKDGETVSQVTSHSYQINYEEAEPAIFNISSGTYTHDIDVTLSTNTQNAVIYYTLDGSKPSPEDERYIRPINISGDRAQKYIKAIAVKAGMRNSDVSSNVYTIAYPQVSDVNFSHNSGTHTEDFELTLTTDTTGASIFYTLDGSTPNEFSSLYSAPIAIAGDNTQSHVRAIAIKTDMRNSAIASGIYTIAYPQVSDVNFSHNSGTYEHRLELRLTTETDGATIYYTLDGSQPSESSPEYNSNQAILLNETGSPYLVNAIAIKNGFNPSTVSSQTYIIERVSIHASLPSGTYHDDIEVHLNVPYYPGAEIFYTTEPGATPSRDSHRYEEPFSLQGHQNTLSLRAIAYLEDNLSTDIIELNYTLQYPAEMPTVSRESGTYTEDFTLQLSHENPEAEIYYRLDGQQPIPGQEGTLLYNDAIEIAGHETSVQLAAIAVLASYKNSAILTGEYRIAYQAIDVEPVDYNFNPGSSAISHNITIRNHSDEQPLAWKIREVKLTNMTLVGNDDANTTSASNQKYGSVTSAKKSSNSLATSDKTQALNDLKERDYVPGEVIVKIKAPANDAALKKLDTINFTALDVSQILQPYGVIQSDVLVTNRKEDQIQKGHLKTKSNSVTVEQGVSSYIVVARLEKSDKSFILKAIKDLEANAQIEYAEPNYVVTKADFLPNDPSFDQLYGLHNTGANGGLLDADIDAPEAWASGHQGNKSILIGIIDTGIDYTHPDLAANIWTNSGEIPDNGIDDDGNGYVDDVHGYDFAYNDGDPMDVDGHGTHVAGTIAGVANNNQGVSGVMWNANLVAIKFLNDSGSGSTDDAIRAIKYANTIGIKITNNSWGGGGFSQGLYDVIAESELFIAAAGNSSTNNDSDPHYPSSYELPNIIAVASTDRNDALSGFSCYGATSVDLAAPGSDIFSTTPNNNYQSFSGTSMATPHVTGVAGLLATYNNFANAEAIKDAIMESVDPIETLVGKMITGGRLNAAKALENMPSAWISVTPKTGTIEPGQSAHFDIMMDPSSIVAGEYAFEIIVELDNNAREQTIPVTVNMSPCRSVNLLSGNIDFGQVRSDTPASAIIELANTCNAPTRIESLPMDIDSGSLVITNGEGSDIPPFGSLSVELNYTANINSLGPFSGHLDIKTNADTNANLRVDLSGSNFVGPELSVTPNNIDVTMASNETRGETLTLSNIGDMPLAWDIKKLPVYFDRNSNIPPIYEWHDIQETGTRLSASNTDDSYSEINFAFDFPFYDKLFRKAFVSSNGLITFESGTRKYTNIQLPSTSFGYAIAGFWDDLNPSVAGDIYFEEFDNKVIVQFQNVVRYSNNDDQITFQMVLHASGEINVFIKEIIGTDDSATIGFQSKQTNSDAHSTNIAFNEAYATNETAIEILTKADWLSFDGAMSGSIEPGETFGLPITLDSAGLSADQYNYFINIKNNGIQNQKIDIPVNLTIN